MYGVQIAFRRFNATAGITKSPWVGMYYFERFFNSPYFASTIKNTLILSLYGLVVSFPIPIILALMLNSFRHKRYRKVIQTVTYAPNFISTVVMCGMIILFLSPSVGVINHVLEAIGIPAVNFMAEKSLLETHLCVDRRMAEYRMELCYLLRSTRRHQPGAA